VDPVVIQPHTSVVKPSWIGVEDSTLKARHSRKESKFTDLNKWSSAGKWYWEH
jgi:hypothetical protein